jgi:hypothetical protein
MAARFVNVQTADLIQTLDGIGARIETRGGSKSVLKKHREIVYDFGHHNGTGSVRVYTTIGAGETELRSNGSDAIRIIVGLGTGDAFKPRRASRRLLRTAPQGSEGQRVAVFLERLTEALRDAYGEAAKVSR